MSRVDAERGLEQDVREAGARDEESRVLLEAVSAAQATLAAILESSDNALISTTLDRKVMTWNAGATAIYGYEPEEVIGRNSSLLVPPERIEEMDGILTELLRMRAELEEAREAALRAMEAKYQFLANTSHELRTPLTSIIGMNELLLRTDLHRDQRGMAEAVKRSAEKLLETIVEILDVSAITTGDLQLDAGEVELLPLVEEVAELVRPSARSKGLGFAWGVDDDAPPVIYGDRSRLRQMLLHLATNAVTFTDRGGIVIRAGRPEHVEVPSVRFTVVDTGIGVAPRDQWRLFRMFSQIDATDTRRFGGNGLGLALVAQLAEAMGGTVGVASSPGTGSTFWFDIPVRTRKGSAL